MKRPPKLQRNRLKGREMNIDKDARVAEGARLIGDGISIGKDSSVWYNAVLRCHEGESVSIGERSNIQDLCMLHTTPGFSVTVGNGVTVGHSSIVHGCTIGDNSLIGMGSLIMDGAVVGRNCIIGAGSLITEGKVIPDGSMAFGRPAKVIKQLSEEQIEELKKSADDYVEESKITL